MLAEQVENQRGQAGAARHPAPAQRGDHERGTADAADRHRLVHEQLAHGQGQQLGHRTADAALAQAQAPRHCDTGISQRLQQQAQDQPGGRQRIEQAQEALDLAVSGDHSGHGRQAQHAEDPTGALPRVRVLVHVV